MFKIQSPRAIPYYLKSPMYMEKPCNLKRTGQEEIIKAQSTHTSLQNREQLLTIPKLK